MPKNHHRYQSGRFQVRKSDAVSPYQRNQRELTVKIKVEFRRHDSHECVVFESCNESADYTSMETIGCKQMYAELQMNGMTRSVCQGVSRHVIE